MRRKIHDCLFALPILGAIAALPLLFMDRAEEKNALIFGLSLFRLFLIGAAFLALIFSVLIFLNRRKKLTFLYYFSSFSAIFSAQILLFGHWPSDTTQNLIPLIAERAKPLLYWMLFSACCWLIGMWINQEKTPKGFGFSLTAAGIFIYWGISAYISTRCWNVRLDGNNWICLITLAALWLWYFVLNSNANRKWKTAAGCLFFIIFAFSVTRSTGMWMGRINTPSSAYWNELAESMLHGKLYLEHPSGTHDLTQYNGKWYVPNPPLPGILLIPWTALLGSAEAINMSVYSAVIAGLNAGLLFLMLILAFTQDQNPLYIPSDDEAYPDSSLSIASWVTVLFIFGTDHLWLGTTGQMWFISQLLTVSFTLLACICVLGRLSPIWAGILLGLGMMCRPNIYPIWLCLLGLYLFQQRPFPRINWKKTIIWCLKSGIPVVISVGLLLLYNKVRFDDWMDFGYVTINGAENILESVQKYGMFNPHFIGINTRVMLFGLPELDFSGTRYFFQPHVLGYSIFLMTPPLIFIFRAFHKNWYSIGTWASVLLSVALLLLYHNTGAEQIGYRYLLDITAPLVLLTADGLHGKVNILYKILTVFAICLSFIAIYWWYLGRV